MEKINKETTMAFGKKIYLLGIDNDDKTVWLEAPNWDCGWYWGFGYIEQYTNSRNPSIAKDILSHTHWESDIIGKQEYYDFEKKCFRISSEHIHHFNENPNFKRTVLTDAESWELADLMKSFYALKKVAGIYKRGNSNASSDCKVDLKNQKKCADINKTILPKIFKRIDEILTSEVEVKNGNTQQ